MQLNLCAKKKNSLLGAGKPQVCEQWANVDQGQDVLVALPLTRSFATCKQDSIS
jgi:hypothetical protein